MSHRKTHWFEKVQVQLVTVAALAVVYFILEPAMRPCDPQSAVAFVPYGRFAAMAMFAGVVCLLAAAAALLTVTSRPEGALLAALIGVGGFSLKSPQMRTLIWFHGDGMAGLFGQLILEMLLLIAILVIASLVVLIVRRIVGAVAPAAIWQDPLEDLTDEERQDVSETTGDRTRFVGLSPMAAVEAFLLNRIRRVFVELAMRGSKVAGRAESMGRTAARSGACLAVACLVCIPLLWLLMRSPQRGQIIFAVLLSNLLGILLGHQFFPAKHAIVAWIMPMLIGIVFYALAAISAIKSGPNAWVNVSDLYRALPVDWLTAGAGGGVLGFWISERIHELRHFERKEKSRKDSGKLVCPKS